MIYYIQCKVQKSRWKWCKRNGGGWKRELSDLPFRWQLVHIRSALSWWSCLWDSSGVRQPSAPGRYSHDRAPAHGFLSARQPGEEQRRVAQWDPDQVCMLNLSILDCFGSSQKADGWIMKRRLELVSGLDGTTPLVSWHIDPWIGGASLPPHQRLLKLVGVHSHYGNSSSCLCKGYWGECVARRHWMHTLV